MKILFEDFLENHKVYAQSETYWENIIKNIANKKQLIIHNPCINTFFSNGEKIYDGDPIAYIYFSSLKKTVRIIQQTFSDDIYKITGWVNKTEYYGEDITELVIVIQLSKETQKVAETLIQKWIIENVGFDIMDKVITTEVEYFRLNYYKEYDNWLKESQAYIPLNFVKGKFENLTSRKNFIKFAVSIYNDVVFDKIKPKKLADNYYCRNHKATNLFHLDCWLKIAGSLAEEEQIANFSFEEEKNLITTLKMTLCENELKGKLSDNLIPTLKTILNNFGIKFLHIPVPKTANVDGAIFWQNNHPVIVLADKNNRTRYDTIVFNLFHELGHLFKKHLKKDSTKSFVDDIDINSVDKKEQEANDYAKNALINKTVWDKFIAKNPNNGFSLNEIADFAKAVSVPQYVVMGRLLFESKPTTEYYRFTYINSSKNKLKLPIKF